MTVRVIGEMSIARAIPLLATYDAGLSLAVGLALPEIEAQIAALVSISAALTVQPPSLAATAAGVASVAASISADPGAIVVTGQVAAIASALAGLRASLASLQAAAAVSIPSATVSLYAYEGPTSAMGAELGSAVSATLPGTGTARALCMATTSSAAWAALAATAEVGT